MNIVKIRKDALKEIEEVISKKTTDEEKLNEITGLVNTYRKASRNDKKEVSDMMTDKAKDYFKKNGCVYGVSEKYEFGGWHGHSYKFNSMEEALSWLAEEESDFRVRELCNKTKATKRKNITFLGER